MNVENTQLEQLLGRVSLRDLVDVGVLQHLQDWFAETAGISVIIRDLDGRPVTRPSGQNAFCNAVMATEYGEKSCRASNRKAVSLAAREHRVVKYQCHAGLSQFAAPIEVRGVCVGTIVMGDRPEGVLDPSHISELSAKTGEAPEGLRDALGALEPWSDAEMTRAMDTLLPVANAIARVCYQGAELRARLHEIGMLYEVSKLLTGTLDLGKVLNLVAKSATEVAGAKGCSLRLLDDRGKELDIMSFHNLSQRYLDKGPVLLERSPIDQAALRGETVLIPDMLNDARILYPKEAQREGFRSGISLGLISKDKPIGTLHLYASQARHFDQQDIRVLRSLANQAAAAIENAQLYQESLEKQRIDQELRVARGVQDQLLPEGAPEIPGFDIAAVGIPCSEVGGDFYDFIALPGGQTVFVIADVAGKGVPGALLMASARAGLRAYVERTHEPREILHRLNLSLCHDARSGQFVSLFCAVLSHDRKRMRFTNAGHNPPLLLRSGAATELEDGGLVLGADESEQYEQQEIELRGGDLVVFYTDGITEAVNGDEEFFDTDGLLEAVRGSPEASAEQMIRNIKAAVDEFSDYRPQADDITMIVLRVE